MLNKDDFNKLYQYACSLTNNSDMAFDFVHDAVIKIQNKKPQNPVSYTKVVIRNLFFDHYNKQIREAKSYEDETCSIDELENMIINKDSVKHLLSKINPEERELLYLWAVEGMTMQEISTEKEIKLGTLLSKVSRIRKKVISLEESHGLV